MTIPAGFQTFHRDTFINYQFNRLLGEGYARAEDLRAIAPVIGGLDDCAPAFLALADSAERDGRLRNAAFYVRAAEFFTPPAAADKIARYRRFRALFERAFADEGLVYHDVPYAGGALPATRLAARAPANGRTLLLFGGFDSLIEEFFCIWRALADAGYDVIAFDGPGQGGALALHGVHHDHDWEKPVGALLDYFALPQAALIGISMGGYWALRAAAFEPRITHVVSWSPVYDWLAQLPAWAEPLVHWMVRRRRLMNASIRLRTRLFPVLNHAVRQAVYIAGGDQPLDAVDWLLGMNRTHLHSARVRQDVLLLGGAEDAFQPVRLLHKQHAALTGARSVTARVFTRAENAAMHCQMGNLPLAVGTIIDWLAD